MNRNFILYRGKRIGIAVCTLLFIYLFTVILACSNTRFMVNLPTYECKFIKKCMCNAQRVTLPRYFTLSTPNSAANYLTKI